MKPIWGACALIACCASLIPVHAAGPSPRLLEVRAKILELEADLVHNVRSQKAAKGHIFKLKRLLSLQREERDLGKKRLAELEHTVSELEKRRGDLRMRIEQQRAAIRRSLTAIDGIPAAASGDEGRALHLPEQERLEAPKRRVLSNLVARGVREIEALKADVQDSDHLEQKIAEERQQLTNLIHDLQEQEGILELNRQLQADLLQRARSERLAQLENYRRLKVSQQQIERMMTDLSARKELEKSLEQERQDSRVARAMAQSAFAGLRGRLPLPVLGAQVLSGFGRSLDAKSGLQVFKKGIELSARPQEVVRCVSAGRIAYSGELPDYGKVAIVDHGDHFYTLVAHLGSLERKAGQTVAAGDPVGKADDSGTPVYFEIRAKNVPVNPLQWLNP